ncbi:caspase family protein [Bradyrhizobium sp. 150]|uniref:VMAP-C domain-containing protein n=1 Tax=Bradyrhizobium sp. 150 TaxID=2782625 RepID=UPI001FF7B120|nr:caspase family protein [Bradyrhizobium sp. 150]MCK1675242.1 hypothetical protein [Bradyrhizobium sp. 150]
MKDIRAFVVGVARYGLAWDAPSAAQNAYAIARLLRAAGVPGSKIHAFIDEEDLSVSQRRKLDTRGIKIRPTLAAEIDNFWRVELRQALSAQDKLLTYWSGHGVTDDHEDRLLFCRDYSTLTNNRLFNASEFLAYLKADGYAHCKHQMFFADVCGSYSGVSTNPTRSRPDASTMREIDQLAVYGSPDGAYANSKNYGAFTSLLIAVSRQFRPVWPNSDDFVARLSVAAEKWGQQALRPFWIQWRSKQQNVGEHLVGRNNGYGKAIAKLLGPYPISPDDLIRSYQKTVRNLRVQPLLQSQALPRIIDALSSIEDSDVSGAPSAIVQFLMRLEADRRTDVPCKADIRAWLGDNCTKLTLTQIGESIAAEIRILHLVIDVSNDRYGTPMQAVADLLRADGWPVAGFDRQLLNAMTDEQLLKWVATLVEKTLDLDPSARPEVHVFVDPPLLHLPFHKIEVNSFELGQQFDCILHYRSRAQDKIITQPENWAAWATSLRAAVLRDAQLLDVHPEPAPLPAGYGICLTSFSHGPKTKSAAQVKRLTQLLMMGAPYVCWPTENRTPIGQIRQTLCKLINGADNFEKIPEEIRKHRLKFEGLVNEVSILWDDPLKRLLPQSKGVAG